MKKLLALILTGIMVFALAGCGNTETPDEPENSGYSEESEDVVKEINMVYGSAETKITVCKPDDAEFTLGSDTPEDAGDLVGLCADDYSWDAEIMGYICYGSGIEGTEAFVDYYYLGETLSEDIESFDAQISDLGVSYEGKPAKLIRYTFKEVGDDEEYKECFVGFEFDDEDGKGLMGLKIGAFEEDLTDSYLKDLFSAVFAK